MLWRGGRNKLGQRKKKGCSVFWFVQVGVLWRSDFVCGVVWGLLGIFCMSRGFFLGGYGVFYFILFKLNSNFLEKVGEGNNSEGGRKGFVWVFFGFGVGLGGEVELFVVSG